MYDTATTSLIYIIRWLLALTQEHQDWGLGIGAVFCLYSQRIGLRFYHKQGDWIYCELVLNLRIKPKQRIKRPVPDVLKQPTHRTNKSSYPYLK